MCDNSGVMMSGGSGVVMSGGSGVVGVNQYGVPTGYCNWVMNMRTPSGRCAGLIVGGLPRGDTTEKLNSFGVTVWVNLCLQEETLKRGDYQERVRELNPNAVTINIPTPDLSVMPDQTLHELVEYIHQRIYVNSDLVYLHCLGGHGRSGTVAACFMMKMYMSSDAESAIHNLKILHSVRRNNFWMDTPQTKIQYDQVYRYANNFRHLVGVIPRLLPMARYDGPPVVVNIRGTKPNPQFTLYIGRAIPHGGWNLPESKWHNPYHGENALVQYKQHLLLSSALISALPELKGQILGCWCKPGPCHGDILIQFYHAYMSQQQQASSSVPSTVVAHQVPTHPG